jgi:uncharacterized membrane protein
MTKGRRVEYAVAVGSFVTAVALSVASLLLSEDHTIAAGNCSLVAQFLVLTASIFGIDYKFNSLKDYERNKEKNSVVA